MMISCLIVLGQSNTNSMNIGSPQPVLISHDNPSVLVRPLRGVDQGRQVNIGLEVADSALGMGELLEEQA
ncbi:hypothetical protein D3C76_1637660 [compost metagenome]